MPKVTNPNFNRLGFETTENLETNPEIGNQIGQALARLIGWNYIEEKWELVLVDSDGRLLVSSGATKSEDNTSSNPAPTTTSANILSANPDRKVAYIQNTGAVDVYLGYGEVATTTQGFLLEVGATLIEDVWVGSITAIVASGTGQLIIQEFT